MRLHFISIYFDCNRIAKLDLMKDKTEVVLIANRRKSNTTRAGNHEVVSKSITKYLRIIFGSIVFEWALEVSAREGAKGYLISSEDNTFY